MTPLLKRLEAGGILTRTRDPQDERQVRIQLSRQGRALRQHAERIPAQMLCISGQQPDTLLRLRGELAEVRNGLFQAIDSERQGE